MSKPTDYRSIEFRVCECSKVATIKKFGTAWVCEDCDRIERMNMVEHITCGVREHPDLNPYERLYCKGDV